MQMVPLSPRFIALCAGAALAAGCAVSSTGSSVPSPLGPSSNSVFSGVNAAQDALKTPALIAVNANGALESWPIRPGGGTHPQILSNPLAQAFGMVANGHVVAIANEHPSGVVVYNVTTKNKRTLPDPYGVAVDIAIGKNAALYVLNFASPANVAMYPAGSSQPKKLVCNVLGNGQAIAVDNEGDIFINGYGRDNATGVFEIPNGPNGPQPNKCAALHLQAEPGYVAGLALDPKTDDLIVLDDPDLCAGGVEGRMTIYPKPYRANTGHSHDLGANCAGGIRLDATSSLVFVGDQDVSGSYTFVLQRSYPNGRDMGTYFGNSPGSFTTIPNTLPN
jgi:hypothetical protein